MRTSKRLLLLAAASAVGAIGSIVHAQATSFSGDLFYTTFRAPNPLPIGPPFISDATVDKVHFNYNGTTFSLGTPSQIHSYGTASSADGLVFAPDGNLLVGGTDMTVHRLSPSGTTFADISTGGAA